MRRAAALTTGCGFSKQFDAPSLPQWPSHPNPAKPAAMLRIDDIRYAVEGRPLFEGASATIPDGHKVGLVGRNGTGKTTLFRLIRNELALEGGSITVKRGAKIGGVAQEVPGSEVSLLDTVAGSGHRTREPAGRKRDRDRWRADRRYPDAFGGYRRLVGGSAGGGDPEGSGLYRGRTGDALFGLLGRLADAGCPGGASCLPRRTCCSWTNQRTIWIWKARSGLRATWPVTPTRSSRSAMTGAC